jgi:hypothetical protein
LPPVVKVIGWAVTAVPASTVRQSFVQGQTIAQRPCGARGRLLKPHAHAHPPMAPKMKELSERYKAAQADGMILYSAWTSCRPGSPSSMTMPMNTVAILQSGADITLSYEEPRMTRRVWMNAQHPANLTPSYMGHAIGWRDGDTLVIDTIGYNGHFQIDSSGLMTSPQLHTVERWTNRETVNASMSKRRSPIRYITRNRS